jgi:hypothetical protein
MSADLLEEHRKMVVMTGNISEFQELQLKQWPYVIFDKDCLDNVYINYDFTKKNDHNEEELHAGWVTYDFNFKKDPPEEHLDKKINALIGWTKNMFWKDTKVEIKKKGKEWVI